MSIELNKACTSCFLLKNQLEMALQDKNAAQTVSERWKEIATVYADTLDRIMQATGEKTRRSLDLAVEKLVKEKEALREQLTASKLEIKITNQKLADKERAYNRAVLLNQKNIGSASQRRLRGAPK